MEYEAFFLLVYANCCIQTGSPALDALLIFAASGKLTKSGPLCFADYILTLSSSHLLPFININIKIRISISSISHLNRRMVSDSVAH